MERRGGQASILEHDLDLYLKMLQGNYSEREQAGLRMNPAPLKDVVFVFTSDGIGIPSSPAPSAPESARPERLSKLLLRHLLKSLITHSVKPRALILMHNAVFLALDTSEFLGNLTVLEEQGLRVLVCGASAEYHEIEDRVKVGQTVDMSTILSELLSARNVVTF